MQEVTNEYLLSRAVSSSSELEPSDDEMVALDLIFLCCFALILGSFLFDSFGFLGLKEIFYQQIYTLYDMHVMTVFICAYSYPVFLEPGSFFGGVSSKIRSTFFA